MGRRLSFSGIAACLVAGLALWFTRASLDVIGGPSGEIRVAMFPSWAEAVGLATLAFVVVFLLQRLMVRLVRRRRIEGGAPTDPLVPLFALGVLAAPYLPWLPDVFPTIRVLAGPARYALWAVVVGQVFWVTWRHLQQQKDSPVRDPEPTWTQVARVWAFGALIVGAAATFGNRAPLHPTTEERRYVAAAQHIVRHADPRPPLAADDHDSVVFPTFIAPAFAIGGATGVTLFLTVIAAALAASAWRWAARHTECRASATFGWLAVTGAAPWLLHGFAISPDVTAGAVVLLALFWEPRNPSGQRWSLLTRGCLLGTLPWLSATYVPLSVAAAAVVSVRHRTPREVALVATPFMAGIVSWLLLFSGVSRSLQPAMEPPPTDAGSILFGVPALLLDQEYGLLPYAPALVLAGAGLWRMFSDGGPSRRLASEMALIAFSLALTVAGDVGGSGRSSTPGRQLVAILPLLVVPIARWDAASARRTILNAAGRTLVLVTLVISAILVTVRGGLLAANRGDGSSPLLEWLAPSEDLVRAAPSFTANVDAPFTPVLIATMWIGAAGGLAYVLGRLKRTSPGVAAAVAVVSMIAAAVATATAVPLAMAARVPPRVNPPALPESTLLSSFDSRARPVAVVYDDWHRVAPDEVPTLFRFEGRPGLRRDPQPLRVLLNTRLALPAGRYDVELKPAGGAAIDGDVGLQLGRTGAPVFEWTAKSPPGEAWIHEFRVDVDTSFVGFRSSPTLEQIVGEVIVRPRVIVDVADRLDRRLSLPSVLAAARYTNTVVYFHDNDTFPEKDGFWVRGASEAVTTFARLPEAESHPLRVRIHTGAAPNRVRFSTGAWQILLDLRQGEARVIEIPIVPARRQAAVRIVSARGFVPADASGGRDRRYLGCWVEVVE